MFHMGDRSYLSMYSTLSSASYMTSPDIFTPFGEIRAGESGPMTSIGGGEMVCHEESGLAGHSP